MKKLKVTKKHIRLPKKAKTIISSDGIAGFFTRGKLIAKLADQRKPIPHRKIINFDSAEEMLSVLTKARRHLMMVIRGGAESLSEICHQTHRDRAAVAKDVKLLEHYGLVTVNEEINPGHGHHKIVHPISRYPIHLETTI